MNGRNGMDERESWEAKEGTGKKVTESTSKEIIQERRRKERKCRKTKEGKER
jgi:hypothetical protein